MKQPAGFWYAIVIACVAGICCAQLVLRSIALREKLGQAFHRGHLLAVVDGQGIYQVDLDRSLEETAYVTGTEDAEADEQQKVELSDLIANFAAQSKASGQRISGDELKRQMNLLRFEFGSEKGWIATLNSSGLSVISLTEYLRENLKARAWISRQIASQLIVTDDECRKFYDEHRDQFFLPEQRNVSHIFLAAPPETPPDVVEAKRAKISVVAAQLFLSPKEFEVLAAQNSEDEATKLREGKLGYLSAKRMPPDFVEEATKLRPGEISPPIRTRLGFHILKLIDVRPARYQTFEEVRGDIAIEIANERRQIAVQNLSADLASTASYLRPL